VMMATGRIPNTDSLGLENTDIEIQPVSGRIVSSDTLKTSVPTIYALGDATTHRYDLTPYAIAEARAWVSQTYNNTTIDGPKEMVVPTAVFSQPPVATVGLTEEAAIHAGHPVKVLKTLFRSMYYSLGDVQEKTFMKLVVNADTDLVLGIHLLGKDTPEMIQLAATALATGMSLGSLERTLALHPSAAEEVVLLPWS